MSHKIAREQINELLDSFADLKAKLHRTAHDLTKEAYIHDIHFTVQMIYDLDKKERSLINRLMS